MIHEVEKQLAREIASGGAASATARFSVENPSFLLHLTIEIFKRNYTTISASDLWTLVNRTSGSGKQEDLNTVVSAQPLNDSYEGETGVKFMRGSVVCTPTSTTGGWHVRATWEPADPTMDQCTFERLVTSCSLAVDGAIKDVT